MSEKKKGFWSWLGFGKKEEVKEQVSQEQTIETDSQNLAENAPLIKAEKQTVVEKHETVSEFIEQKLDEAKHFVEEKLDAAEHIIDELEEKIEQSFEEEKEESVAIVDTAHHDSNETLQAVEIADEIATIVKTPKENKAVEETQLEPEQAVEIPEEVAERATETEAVTEETQDEYQEKPANKTGFFNRLIQGLIKTKQNIGSGFLNFFRGKKLMMSCLKS